MNKYEFETGKLSQIIEGALQDLELVEKDPNYRVGMNHYHTYRETADICIVCLAGSVMAKTLTIDRKSSLAACDFENNIDNRLRALDNIRRGYIQHAILDFKETLTIEDLELYWDKSLWQVSVIPYDKNPEQFKTDVLNIAKLLASKGL